MFTVIHVALNGTLVPVPKGTKFSDEQSLLLDVPLCTLKSKSLEQH